MNVPALDMILRAGWVGKTIVLLMIAISLAAWAIIFSRYLVLAKVNGGNRAFRKRYGTIGKLSEMEKLDDELMRAPMAQLGKAGAIEYRRILEDAHGHTNVKDWSFFLQNQFAMAAEHIESAYIALTSPLDKGFVFLAMTSSIAPFLGLLGTVWGIMNSFFEIGNQGSASLPVVAPGIAEALISTLMGLAVAIPALFFYNIFVNKAEHIEDEMDEFKSVLLARLKREIFSLLYMERSGLRPVSGGAPGTKGA